MAAGHYDSYSYYVHLQFEFHVHSINKLCNYLLNYLNFFYKYKNLQFYFPILALKSALFCAIPKLLKKNQNKLLRNGQMISIAEFIHLNEMWTFHKIYHLLHVAKTLLQRHDHLLQLHDLKMCTSCFFIINL